MAIVQSINSKRRHLSFLPKLVDKLGMALATPESTCVIQDSIPNDEDSVMYFINRGTCTVQITENKETVTICELLEGSHFGEIHLLWDCARTATVISNNYNTHVRLRRDNFEELIS